MVSSLSQQASNALVYVTYAAFLCVVLPAVKADG